MKYFVCNRHGQVAAIFQSFDFEEMKEWLHAKYAEDADASYRVYKGEEIDFNVRRELHIDFSETPA